MKQIHSARSSGHTTVQSISFVILLFTMALLSAACNRTSNVNNSNGAANTSNASVTSNANAKTPETKTTGSPSASFKAFIEAIKKNDVDGIKRVLSKSSMEMIAEEATRSGKSVEEFIKEQNKDSDMTTQEIEVTGEKIEGDNATVDYKQRGSNLKALLVKENNEWKLAYDKMMKQMEEEMDKLQKQGAK